MSYLEKLKQSRDKSQVAYQEFALHTRQDKDGLFCFFEGKDNAYYSPRIKRFTDNYHLIMCGGRDKVLDVYRLITIHSEYDKYKKAFFIDRDFNEPLLLHNPPIFETPCYSIENFYVSVNVFKEILKNEFHLSEVSDPAFQVCITLFKDRQEEFHQATTLFNAWYACLVEIRNTTGKEIGVNLDDKFPKNFIDLTLESVSVNYDLEKIKQTFPQALEVSENILNAKITEFIDCQHCKVFRGKYEMWFLLVFLRLILRDSNKSQLFITEKLSFTFNNDYTSLNPILTNEQALTAFNGYAETHESLNVYLTQVIK
ncbi:DUF4435 domain-containing protein [Anabaena lutea]|uniref:DUF4435 domain-containing protein n=1 Tax=Anabaena lutea FACHB-196 TaxID=2692881 RepID=A0ABR8FMF2_9NOST|nr:DUF4435 domain-containing protein [Anabaena lutea]MBD2570857.1 DUF4435 domain-containing protein [Anabaena lutea FACHB-196]